MRRIASRSFGVQAGLITAVMAVLAGGVCAAARPSGALRPLPNGSAAAVSAPAAERAPAASSTGPGLESSLADKIDRLVRDPALAKMRIGLRIERLSPQMRLVYEHNSRALFTPASNQKLLVASAAVCLLPPDFRYRTILGRRSKDLVIIGAGDPGFGDPKLAKQSSQTITGVFRGWADKLKAAGVTRIEGDLVFDDFIFDQQHIHPKWPAMFNLQDWYTAPVGGLNFNDNCVDVVVARGKAVGEPAAVTLIPSTPYCVVQNRAVTAGKGEPAISRSGNGPLTISVSGQVSRSGSADSGVSIPIVDPGMFFASAARTVLAGQGIEIAGQTRRQQVRGPDGALPAGFDVLAVHEQSLPPLLVRMNTNSLNVCAEAMLKTLGAYSREGKPAQQGTLATGRAAVGRFLDSLGLTDDLYVLDDGSGLSRDNRTAPIVFTTILRHMDAHPQREMWGNSLAEAGEPEGSLKRRMKDLRGKVFGKTGHINSVSTLSGYAIGPRGQRYCFSILCNDTYRAKGGTSAAHTMQDAICRLLTTWDQ